jgi:hypothetical protein
VEDGSAEAEARNTLMLAEQVGSTTVEAWSILHFVVILATLTAPG